jgi:phosphatidylserine decarboxylase
MKIPFTPYGLPQVLVFPAIIIAAMFLCLFIKPYWLLITLEIILLILFIFVLSFFRDPERNVLTDKNLLISPADGTVADIETMDCDYIGGKAIRVGIFLSVFNVHINRSPCNSRVEKTTIKFGQFKDARHPLASKINAANDIAMVRTDPPYDRLLVRQITGAIARRIVCKVNPGDNLQIGQRFGMIKFGSRTELYVPATAKVTVLVKKGDKVKAGITPLVRYE